MLEIPDVNAWRFVAAVFLPVSLHAAPLTDSDWKPVRFADTLEVYSNGSYTGTLSHGLSVNDGTGTIVDETRLLVETRGLSPGEISTLELCEERTFGFDGNLISAYEELKSPAGTNRWNLVKEGGGWELSITAGGTTQVRKIGALSENATMMYRLYSGMKNRTVKRGEAFCDTSFDLASGQVCFARFACMETPSAKNTFHWVFITFNNLTARDERWELDTNGNTIFQENFPYVLRERGGRSGAPGRERAPPLFETFTIPARRAAAENENIALSLDSSAAPDSSVSRFYAQRGNSWVLRNVSASCPEKASPDPGDSIMAEFTRPTPTMQSDDKRIVKLADSLVKRRAGRCDSIRACCEYVNTTLKKQYSPTFSNALETLAAGFGDCGEHAVLLGALLRAANIPARVVLGLVYVDGRKGYLYHAWVMAYVGGGSWVFADAALGVFPAKRDRVPLVIDDTGSAVMGIAKMLGRIKVEYVRNR
jgi:transglutaminase-like putative cysteine protease